MKVMVKERTVHSAQRSMQLGRPVIGSTTNGVSMARSKKLVIAAMPLTQLIE